MPEYDPSSGRAFIWLIACFLFISILTGGACLAAYLILPESQISSWIPIVGVTLVCLPWAFWFLTFLYRIFSRCFGCRVRFGIGGDGGGGRGGGRGGGGGRDGGAAANAPAGNADVEAAGQAKGGKGMDGLNRESSVASHESEMPLTNSMAS